MVKNFKKWLTKVVTQFNPQLHRCGKQIESKRSNRFSPESNLTVQANRSGSCPINVFNVKAVRWRQHPTFSQTSRLTPRKEAEH